MPGTSSPRQAAHAKQDENDDFSRADCHFAEFGVLHAPRYPRKKGPPDELTGRFAIRLNCLTGSLIADQRGARTITT
jgi:hypothetical protein